MSILRTAASGAESNARPSVTKHFKIRANDQSAQPCCGRAMAWDKSVTGPGWIASRFRERPAKATRGRFALEAARASRHNSPPRHRMAGLLSCISHGIDSRSTCRQPQGPSRFRAPAPFRCSAALQRSSVPCWCSIRCASAGGAPGTSTAADHHGYARPSQSAGTDGAAGCTAAQARAPGCRSSTASFSADAFGSSAKPTRL